MSAMELLWRELEQDYHEEHPSRIGEGISGRQISGPSEKASSLRIGELDLGGGPN